MGTDELLGEAAGVQQRQDGRREAGEARADSSGGTRPLWLLQGLRLPAPPSPPLAPSDMPAAPAGLFGAVRGRSRARLLQRQFWVPTPPGGAAGAP